MCEDCSEELITTSQGPQGEQGEQGEPGINGTDGILDWSDFDLSCWLAEGIIEAEDDNEEITQNFIDVFCEMYQQINIAPVAVNDYRVMNQDTTLYIEVINNDNYYPDVTVTIDVAPSNGVATIEPDNKTVKYIPTSGFIGVDDFDYTIDDGDATSTATVSITVQEVISQQTIQDTIIEQLQILLSSDEYWDLSFAIGDKIAIRNETLTNFDFTNPFTAGMGTGRYAKWAICNGNNGTEDHSNNTLRGFNHADADYDTSALVGGSDSSTFGLTIDNIPPHRHVIDNPLLDNSFLSTYTPLGGGDIEVGANISNTDGADLQHDVYEFRQNTGDGTTNLNDQNGLQATPDDITIDVRNAYSVIILIQKIA